MRGAVLLKTNFYNSFVERAFSKLKAEVPQGYDVFLALNSVSVFETGTILLRKGTSGDDTH
jgi:hypothetical protein